MGSRGERSRSHRFGRNKSRLRNPVCTSASLREAA